MNWEEKRSKLIAQRADQDKEISAFRHAVLDDKLLSVADVDDWIEHAHEADGRLCKPPREGRSLYREDVLRRVRKAFDRGTVCSISIDDGTITTKRRRIHLIHGGVLNRLYELAAEIARRYHWQLTQAVLFILTGKPPFMPSLSLIGDREDGFVVFIGHSATQRDLAVFYRRLRKKYGIKDRRPSRKGINADDLDKKSARQQKRRDEEKLQGIHPMELLRITTGGTTRVVRVTMSTSTACKQLSEKFHCKVTRAKLYRMLSEGKIIRRKRGGLDRWELPGAREEALKSLR